MSLYKTEIKKISCKKKKNVVVIIVESLTYKYIDYLNEGKKYGVTPNIDKIASEGLIFSNFFANGQRSIEGAQAILTGIPPLPGIPDIISLSVNYSRLGELAKANHYRTIFVTSTLKESFSLDLMVYASGIEEYYGREDYNLLLNYPEARERTLGWDYETFMLLFDKLSIHSQPFIAFVNASSDHGPFPQMHEPFNKYEHGTDSEGGYLNMLHYTDWAIGEFMAKMSKQEYFNDTVFVITADHALAHFQADDPYGKFRIPLILYSPKHIPKGNSERFASQIDIIPSMIDILNLEGKFSNIGKSIFVRSNNFAITKEGSLLNIFAKEGFIAKSFIDIFPNEYLLDNEFNKITNQNKSDIEKGVSILNSISKYDNAQSCVVSDGYVLAIEAVEGTDKMISRIGSIKKKISRDLVEGCLIKIPKKKQNLNIDLPTVGIKTLDMMHKNKLNVLALRKDFTIVVGKKNFYRSLKKYNISLSFIN